MLVGPCCVTSLAMNDPVNRVYPDEVPGINRRAAIAGVAGQSGGVERERAAINACRGSAVKLVFIETDAFVVLRPRAGRRRTRRAGGGTADYSIACRIRGRVQRAVIGDIVEYAHRAGRTSGYKRHQPWKRIGRLGSGYSRVGNAVSAKRCKIRAVRRPAVNGGNTVDTVFEIECMHAVNTEQQDMAKLAAFVIVALAVAILRSSVDVRHGG